MLDKIVVGDRHAIKRMRVWFAVLLLFVVEAKRSADLGVGSPRGGTRRRGLGKKKPHHDKGSSSKGSNKKGCGNVETFWFYLEEVRNGRRNITVGDSLVYPIYRIGSNESVGSYKDTAIYTGDGDCQFTASYNLDASNDTYASQIMLQGTCNGESNAVVGGTGNFSGASGYDVFPDNNSTIVRTVDLTICSSACSKCSS